jgi:RNA polymerase sigma factor (sigma-70 family)
MYSDEVLWNGMLRGDQAMFISLYKRYYHTLLFIGIRAVKDVPSVKDAIHQLFLYLWEKRQSIHPAKNVKSYLLTSFLRRLNLDWKKAGKISNLQVVQCKSFEDSLLTPEEKLVRKDQQSHQSRILIEHIKELPGRQQELLCLKFYDGYSYEEIVRQTGLSHRTVYNKIHEALKKLRVDLVRYGKSQIVSL